MLGLILGLMQYDVHARCKMTFLGRVRDTTSTNAAWLPTS